MRKYSLLLAALLIPDRPADVIIKGFHMVQSKLEKRELDLRATTADVYRSEEFYVLTLPRSNIRGDGGESFNVEGTRALFNIPKSLLYIQSDARIETPESLIFKTNALDFDTKKKIATSQDDVQVFQKVKENEEPLFDLTGKGLVIDINKGTYNILSNIRAQKSMSGNLMKITSRESTFDSKNKQLYFIKKVLVNAPKYSAYGDKLIVGVDADSNKQKSAEIKRMEFESEDESTAKMSDGMIFHGKGLTFELEPTGEVKESSVIGSAYAEMPSGAKLHAEKLNSIQRDGNQVILLDGTVEIQVDNKIAHCQKGEYYPSTGDFLLEQVASIDDGNQVINGEKIRYSLKEDRVFVERATGTLDRKGMQPKKAGDGAGGR